MPTPDETKLIAEATARIQVPWECFTILRDEEPNTIEEWILVALMDAFHLRVWLPGPHAYPGFVKQGARIQIDIAHRGLISSILSTSTGYATAADALDHLQAELRRIADAITAALPDQSQGD